MELPEELLFQDWRPGCPREGRMVSRMQIPGLYGLAHEAGSVTFTWNDGGDPVMIVGVGPDWSVATLMINQDWYSCVTGDAEGFGSIDLCGQTCEWPRAELLPRAAALPVLMTVPDLTTIRRGFRWRPQWREAEAEPAPVRTAV